MNRLDNMLIFLKEGFHPRRYLSVHVPPRSIIFFSNAHVTWYRSDIIDRSVEWKYRVLVPQHETSVCIAACYIQCHFTRVNSHLYMKRTRMKQLKDLLPLVSFAVINAIRWTSRSSFTLYIGLPCNGIKWRGDFVSSLYSREAARDLHVTRRYDCHS